MLIHKIYKSMDYKHLSKPFFLERTVVAYCAVMYNDHTGAVLSKMQKTGLLFHTLSVCQFA